MYRGYKLSKGSQGYVDTLTMPLQRVIKKGFYIANTRKLKCPDISIVRGLETAAGQFELFKIGRELVDDGWTKTGKTVTNCDGYNQISDHQKTDEFGLALAFDYAAWVFGTNYCDGNMALIATCFFEAASDEKVEIEWGGNYRSLSDGSHISLVV